MTQATQQPVAGFTRALVLVFIALPVVLVVGALGAVVYLSSRAPREPSERRLRVTPTSAEDKPSSQALRPR